MTEDATPRLPNRKPASDPKKVKSAIITSTVAIACSAIVFLFTQHTNSAIQNAGDTTVESTVVSTSTSATKTVQFQVGSVAVVDLLDNGSSMLIENITPLSGWVVGNISNNLLTGIEITFSSWKDKVTFHAIYKDGSIVTSISTTAIFQVPVTTQKPVYRPPVTTVKPTTTTVKSTTTTSTTTTVPTTEQTTTTTERRNNDD